MTDRFAVFVDAGYLLATGAWATVGTYRRAESVVAIPELATWLRHEAESDAGGRELLRLYWYDAAPRREPTPEQRDVAAQPDTKLRLGSLNAWNQQKGVDALLLTDVIDLAAARSIDLAYLVSGDEDLVEVVRRVQSAGVRVVLWGVETPRNTVSVELRHEADRCRMLSPGELAPFFERASAGAGEPLGHKPPDEARTPGSGAKLGPVTGARPGAPLPPPLVRPPWVAAPLPARAASTPPPVTYADVDPDAAAEAGRRFAREWLEEASPAQVDELRQARPQIPSQVDGRLLAVSCRLLGVSPDDQLGQEARVALRRGFWEAADARLGEPANRDASPATPPGKPSPDAGGATPADGST